LSGEAALVAASGGSVPVVTMLCGACEAVQALAQAKGLRLDFVSEGAVEAQGLEVGELARHALISLISLTTKSAKPGSTVRVESTLAQEVVNVAISFSCEAHPSAESLGTALKLLNLVNAELTKSESKAGCVLTVRLPTIRKTRVLLVDDNADLAGLFERFLRETRYALSVARDAETGLAMAAQCEAEIIVLDVMMSGRDGWSLLQQLSNSGSACSLPVVICSAIHDPELAMSLGAVASLTKPVTRMELLRALETAERRTAASPQ
jgi:CheY-like chemotaxis protein